MGCQLSLEYPHDRWWLLRLAVWQNGRSIKLAIDWVTCGETDGTERKCIPRKLRQRLGFSKGRWRGHTHTLSEEDSWTTPLPHELRAFPARSPALTGHLVLHRSSLSLITFSGFSGMNPHVSVWDGGGCFSSSDFKAIFLIWQKGTINKWIGGEKAELAFFPTGRFTLDPNIKIILEAGFASTRLLLTGHRKHRTQLPMLEGKRSHIAYKPHD